MLQRLRTSACPFPSIVDSDVLRLNGRLKLPELNVSLIGFVKGVLSDLCLVEPALDLWPYPPNALNRVHPLLLCRGISCSGLIVFLFL